MKLLIVDDSISARFFLKSCIAEHREYEIYEATNGKDGVDSFREHRPKITFLDITMPVMDGFEALKEIKSVDPEALVIILTSDIQKKTTQRIMDLGAFQFLGKPPTREKIEEALIQAEEKLRHG